MAEFIQSQSEDLWSKAVASLKPEFRELFSAEKVDRRGALEVLLYEAQMQRELCIRKQWRITKKSGDIIILRDVFEKIIQCVDKFKMLGNAAVEFAPGYASVPWAVIKMLLQTSINDTTAFAAMIDGVEEVTSTIARCAIFEAVYMKHTTSATEHLEASLVFLYAAVLNFLGISCKYFSTNTGKRFMKATLDPVKEIEDALKRVRSKQQEVERTAQIASMEIIHDTSTRMHDLTAMVGSLFAQLETANSGIAMLNDKSQGEAAGSTESVRVAIASIMGPTKRTIQKPNTFNDHLGVEERNQVFDWLSSLRYASHHLTEAKGRLRDSGEWLFQRSEFLSWTNSSISGTLWVHGMPGCGKTKLASAVIDVHLTQAAEQGAMAAPIAYFYCSRNSAEAGRSEPEEVFRCIARQLCRDDPEELVNENLLHEWEHVGRPQVGQSKLDAERVMDLISKTLAANPATIVIDALDELRADKRHEVFEYLDQIVKQSPNVVKVLLTSRNDGDIVCRLDTTPNIYISAQDNRADIERFIDAELDKAIAQKRLLRGHVSADVRLRIILTLNHGAQGMFRWVSLQIQNLCDPQRMKLEEDVLHELRQLPQSLFDLYKIAFDQMCQLGPSSYEVALSALQLLLVAVRPITWPEILHILQVSHNSIQRGISREELLDITCNFLDDDGRQECPRFAHQSVREYLESRPDFANGVSDAKAAQMCFHHITAQETAHASDFCYSSFYLGSHLSATPPEKRIVLRPLLEKLLLPPSLQGAEREQSDLFQEWRRRVHTFIGAGMFAVNTPDYAEKCVEAIVSVSPLAAICAMGLDEMMMMLKPSSSEIFGGIIRIPFSGGMSWGYSRMEMMYRGRNCFMLAVLLDQPRIVTAVRNLGFSVDTPSATGMTALSLAAELGKADVIQQLLVCGANPNQTYKEMVEDDIFHPAARGGGAEVAFRDTQFRISGTSLGFHVYRDGHREIQSPFACEGERKPVIHVAMNNKHGVECVRALIEFGADVNMRTSSNATPLQGCLEYGNLKIMFEVFHMLLKAGANTSALLESGRTIAHIVAAMGHCELIRQLLDIGADCSSRDIFQQTPLELAIRYGHAEIAELLESKYGPPEPRNMSNDPSEEQDLLSPLPGSSIPSISLQDYGSSSQPPAFTEANHPTQPSQPRFTSHENFEWNQVVNAEKPKRSRYRRSISNLFKKMKSGS
ncbi:hypothetical protein ACHAPT_006631 [Fusarium lateritium]